MQPVIMIVEDDGIIAIYLETLLKQWGYEALIAGSGEESLELADKKSPELALMDIRLEHGMDGITAAKELLDRFNIPVIYITAYADNELIARAKHTEPYGYLIKPVQELTLRSTLEMAISRIKIDRKLKKALQEKEILIRETLHRTKNNMGSICSLLQARSGSIKDQYILDIFKDIENRIQMMMLGQEKLYKSKDLVTIDLAEYIKDFANIVFNNFQVSRKRDSIVFNLDSPVIVSIDNAMTCGMILNELLTNALKYAFPENSQGKIVVSLKKTIQGEIEFGVCDNGVGMPDGFDFKNTKSMGMVLIKLLTGSYLAGNLELRAKGTGTEFVISFRAEQDCSELQNGTNPHYCGD